jgi:hypothetical protein
MSKQSVIDTCGFLTAASVETIETGKFFSGNVLLMICAIWPRLFETTSSASNQFSKFSFSVSCKQKSKAIK